MPVRKLLSAFLCVTLFAALVSPAGFMPDFTGGGFAIRICPGWTDTQVSEKKEHIGKTPTAHNLTAMAKGDSDAAHHGDHDAGKTNMKPCAFAGAAAHALTPSADIVLAQAARAAFYSPAPMLRQFAGRALRLPPATGPPA